MKGNSLDWTILEILSYAGDEENEWNTVYRTDDWDYDEEDYDEE